MKEVVKQKVLKKRIDGKKCMDCKGYARKLRSYGAMFLCYKCYNNRVTVIGKKGMNQLSIKEALAKTYEINGYLNPKGQIIAHRSFPQILIGHKVKLVLVDGEEK